MTCKVYAGYSCTGGNTIIQLIPTCATAAAAATAVDAGLDTRLDAADFPFASSRAVLLLRRWLVLHRCTMMWLLLLYRCHLRLLVLHRMLLLLRHALHHLRLLLMLYRCTI
jgi:hypothetical protein